MKKSFLTRFSVLLAIIFSLSIALTSCFDVTNCFGGNNDPTTYTIQYTDDAGTHTLTVTAGMPYFLESIPYKYGYEFLGLFDAQTGGTQYVSANGSSLSPYNDKENKVLFPQFKAIDYTVVLDYQGAAVTGERSLIVSYGSNLPELPKNLVLEHNNFTGWYTEAGSKGKQISDSYGNLPMVSVLNENNFNLDDTTRRVNLYAGFELETYTVTFYFDAGMPEEVIEVPYNTPISQIVPKTRNNKGEAGFVWSKSQNDKTLSNVFDGRVTSEMVLYVAEWAPVIEFNVNGGDDVTPVVARAGSNISLPTPTKSLAKFLYWETVDGKEANITTMPSSSTSLKAVWQGKIEFDENGGSEVNDISEKAGASITLPTPEKEGYVFAGWYTANKEKYERTTMPSSGILLKAGWYKEKTVTNVLLSGTDYIKCSSSKDTFVDKLTMDFSAYLSSDFNGIIKLNVKWKEKDTGAMAVGFYAKRVVSNEYRIARTYYGDAHPDYINMSKYIVTNLEGNKIYVTIACSANGGLGSYWYNGCISDFRYELIYPDTTYLYL